MGATPYILHENCIKDKKYYFKARVEGTSGKKSPWTSWVGKVAGDTVMPTVIETSHITAVSNPQNQVSYFINDTYTTPGDFEVFRWYAQRRYHQAPTLTWQASYATNYYEGTRNHTYTLKAEYLNYFVWDVFIGVMDVAGNINIPSAPQLVGVNPTSQLHTQDYSHNIELNSIDADTVGWQAGILTLGNNERYNIAANNTGDMNASTYIYLDTDVSLTELQTTITASGASGPNRKLVAIGKNSANEAIFQTFGGLGGMMIRAEHIEAYSISGNNISAATTITAGAGNNVGVLDGYDALWRIYAGHATPASAPFRVNQAGSLYATDATITGTISGVDGTIGGWTINANSITGNTNTHIKAGQTDFGVGTGFYLGHDGADYKFSIGSTHRNLEWDGTNLTISGMLITGLQPGSEQSIQGWSHNITVSGLDADTVGWSSGTITLTSGDTFSIGAGNTGNMSAVNYIYLDKNTSSTVLQTTTTAGTAVGAGKILLAVAENNSGSDATFQTFGGEGGAVWKAGNIAANTITANEIAANTITAGEIFADTITANEIAANAVTAVEIAANTILASNIRAGTISGQNIAADARIVAGTGNNVAVLDGAHVTDRIYAGHSVSSSAPFKVTQAGALTATNATIKTASGIGQRVEMSSASNDFKWYNASNENVLSIGSNAYGGYPGLSTLEGLFFAGNSSVNPWSIGATKTIQTTPASNHRAAIYGSVSSTVSGTSASKKAIGVWGVASLEEDSDVRTDMDFVGVWGDAFQNMEDHISGDLVGVWGTAGGTALHTGAAWAVKSQGNLLVTGKTVNQGKLQLSGLFETSANMTISGQAGEDPTLLIRSHSTAESDRPTISFQHERAAGGTSGCSIQMHEFALKINCDEQFFLTNNANNSMVVHGNNDVEFYEDVTVSGVLTIGGSGSGAPSVNADIFAQGKGVVGLLETTTPTADTNYGKLYTKSTNKFHFQDGAGTERVVSDNSWEDLTSSTGAGVSSNPAIVTANITTGGSQALENVSLADGVKGVTKIFTVAILTDPTDTVKVTPANLIGGTQITFSAIGQGCIMSFMGTNWIIVGNNGGVIA